VCHQVDGAGKEGLYPPLASSEWVQGDENKLIRIILGGLTGPVEVAGETFNGAMPGWGPVLEDKDVAAVATYIRSSWGNKAGPITAAKVAAIRSATASRKVPWTVGELAGVK
jgi:mono/diheme cytochrome c family protein